ncbi:MAG: hypothetical protein ABIR08_07680 [Sphingomonas sp.]
MASFLVLGAGRLAAFLFCLIRAVIDLRARRLGWGVAGLIVCGLLAWGSMTPISTHAVKVDLPVGS